MPRARSAVTLVSGKVQRESHGPTVYGWFTEVTKASIHCATSDKGEQMPSVGSVGPRNTGADMVGAPWLSHPCMQVEVSRCPLALFWSNEHIELPSKLVDESKLSDWASHL